MSSTISLLSLPSEILSRIILLSMPTSRTGQRHRRTRLVNLANVCRVFSQICLHRLYTSLAYEVSPSGSKLLETLKKANGTSTGQQTYMPYLNLARDLSIRDAKNGPGRMITSSRVAKLALEMDGDYRYMDEEDEIDDDMPYLPIDTYTFNAAVTEEDSIASLLRLLGPQLLNLKYETNLLPPAGSAPSFSTLVNLERLTIFSQVGFYDVKRSDRFLLTLPKDILLNAFSICWRDLRYLHLWECSFLDFLPKGNGAGYDGKPAATEPAFKLETLILRDCFLPGQTLSWLTDSSVKAASLQTLRLDYLRAPSKAIQSLISKSAPTLEDLTFSCDEGNVALADWTIPRNTISEEKRDWTSCFSSLDTLSSLHLAGTGITSSDFQALSKTVFSSLNSLVLDYTATLSPNEVIETLQAIPLGSPLKELTLKGRAPVWRYKYGGLTYSRVQEPQNTDNDDWQETPVHNHRWDWTAEEFAILESLIKERKITFHDFATMMQKRKYGEERMDLINSDDKYEL